MIKYGTGLSVIEAENMIFVRRNTTVPVPRVYAIYSNMKTSSRTNKKYECIYIVMERVAGSTLASEWDSLSSQQKEIIATQLRGHLNQIRSIPSPGYYGSIGKRGLLDCIFWTGDDASAPLDGPFDTEHELNDAMRRKYLYNRVSDQKAEFYRFAFPIVLQGHLPVFTHGDFQRKNIMIQRIPAAAAPGGPSSETKAGNPQDDTFEVTIIDWETAGWYPSYWQSAIALFACGNWKDDWHAWLGKSMDLYLNEFVWMQMLRLELWS